MIDTAIHHPASNPDVLNQATHLRSEVFPTHPNNPAIALDREAIQSRIAAVLKHLV
jgi:hypothetical protein